jgi:hypothetical protein
LCPGCREDQETHQHYIQCGAPTRIQWRISLLANLCQQLTKLSTNDQLKETIIDCIDRAMAGRHINTHGPCRQALEAQQHIGWLHMLQGYWTKEWQEAYTNTYMIPTDKDQKKRNKRLIRMVGWQKNVIQTVWGAMIKLWKLLQ